MANSQPSPADMVFTDMSVETAMKWHARETTKHFLAIMVLSLGTLGFSGCGIPLAADPHLTFDPIGTQTLLNPALVVKAQSSSPAPIVYAIMSGPAEIAGDHVKLTGAGHVILYAKQPKSGEFASTSAQAEFDVDLATPQLTLDPVSNHVRTDTTIQLAARSSSPAPITYSVVSGPGHITGNVFTIDGAGLVTINATQSATPVYGAASAVTRFTIAPAVPSLALQMQWNSPSTLSISSTSNSDAPVTFTLISGPAILSGSTLKVSGPGTLQVRGDQQSSADFVAASTTTSIDISGPSLTLTPTALQFPSVIVGQSSDKLTVQVRNGGDLPASLQEIAVPQGFLVSNACSGLVSAHSSCSLSLTFAPTSSGSVSGVLVAMAPPSEAKVTLSAQAVDARMPVLTALSQNSIQAGQQTTIHLSGTDLDLLESLKIGLTSYNIQHVTSTDIAVNVNPSAWLTGSVSVNGLFAGKQTNTLKLNLISLPVSYDVAVRFAQQATMAVTADQIAQIQTRGLAGWIDWQLKTDMFPYETRKDMVYGTYMANTQVSSYALRQRTTLALKEIYTFGASDQCFQSECGHYWEARLQKDAFGNFRDLLTDVTRSPLMGAFMSNLRNFSNFPWIGDHRPNQNYGRELMQLMTIGPVKLNHDGSTFIGANGSTVPNYSEDNVADMAGALSGFYRTDVGQYNAVTDGDPLRPMDPFDPGHYAPVKSPLPGLTLPWGQNTMSDTNAVLDALFQHANVAPFVTRRLIQHFVTSNPSPQYITRISDVFENDGTGVRGNLGAVVKAILLDPEARRGDDPATAVDVDSHLLEPLLYVSNAMAALGGTYTDDRIYIILAPMGQDLFMSPNVFGPYSPDNKIPTGEFAPEAQLVSNSAYLQRIAFVSGMTQQGFGGLAANLASSPFYNASSTQMLLDQMRHFLFHGRMPEELDKALQSYVAANPTKSPNELLPGLCLIALTSSSFQVVR